MNKQEPTDRVQRIAEILAKYVPDGTALRLSQMVEDYKFHLTITRPRNSKLGDYRAPHGKQGHRISVNGSLNRYAFIITFIHEVAHLVVWERHRDRVSPHGQEWKTAFKEVMKPYLTNEIFPEPLLKELRRHMVDPAASTVQDHTLMRVLRNYDQPDHLIPVDAVLQGSTFFIQGRAFIKGERLRKRYRCKEVATGRTFLVSGIAMVESG